MSVEWRDHPGLRGKFHPEYPDDLQVVVHDGGPRMTDRRPELVWVRVLSHDGGVFTGEVLNRPEHLLTVKQGDRVQFLVPESGEHPLMVRPKYLQERGEWVIQRCDHCGLSELLDAPSDLIARTFPDLPPGESPVIFTVICGLCGGIQVAESIDSIAAGDSSRLAAPARAASPGKRWWQFWK